MRSGGRKRLHQLRHATHLRQPFHIRCTQVVNPRALDGHLCPALTINTIENIRERPGTQFVEARVVKQVVVVDVFSRRAEARLGKKPGVSSPLAQSPLPQPQMNVHIETQASPWDRA